MQLIVWEHGAARNHLPVVTYKVRIVQLRVAGKNDRAVTRKLIVMIVMMANVLDTRCAGRRWHVLVRNPVLRRFGQARRAVARKRRRSLDSCAIALASERATLFAKGAEASMLELHAGELMMETCLKSGQVEIDAK